MHQNEFFSKGSFSVTGTPFDPYGADGRAERMNARVMPSPFLLPYQPVRFTMLRNTIPEDCEPTGYGFF